MIAERINIWKNRDSTDITFTLLSDEQTVKISGYNPNYIRIIEDNNDPLFKKDHPNREILPSIVEFLGGPFIFIGQDVNDYIFNKKTSHLSKEYLESTSKRLITKIKVTDLETFLTYEEKSTKKEPKTTKKDSSKEAE